MEKNNKLKEDDIIEIRLYIDRKMLNDLDKDEEKIKNFINKFKRYINKNNIKILVPIFIKDDNLISKTDIEEIVYISLGISRWIADFYSLPVLVYEK